MFTRIEAQLRWLNTKYATQHRPHQGPRHQEGLPIARENETLPPGALIIGQKTGVPLKQGRVLTVIKPGRPNMHMSW